MQHNNIVSLERVISDRFFDSLNSNSLYKHNEIFAKEVNRSIDLVVKYRPNLNHILVKGEEIFAFNTGLTTLGIDAIVRVFTLKSYFNHLKENNKLHEVYSYPDIAKDYIEEVEEFAKYMLDTLDHVLGLKKSQYGAKILLLAKRKLLEAWNPDNGIYDITPILTQLTYFSSKNEFRFNYFGQIGTTVYTMARFGGDLDKFQEFCDRTGKKEKLLKMQKEKGMI